MYGMIQLKKTPSHTAIHSWVNQVGYYKLTMPKEIADDWIYLVDNSLRIENRIVVLVLGIRSSTLKKGTIHHSRI